MTLPSTLILPLLVLVFIGDSVICALAGVSAKGELSIILLVMVSRKHKYNYNNRMKHKTSVKCRLIGLEEYV